jgi:hypothetical protein
VHLHTSVCASASGATDHRSRRRKRSVSQRFKLTAYCRRSWIFCTRSVNGLRDWELGSQTFKLVDSVLRRVYLTDERLVSRETEKPAPPGKPRDLHVLVQVATKRALQAKTLNTEQGRQCLTSRG